MNETLRNNGVLPPATLPRAVKHVQESSGPIAEPDTLGSFLMPSSLDLQGAAASFLRTRAHSEGFGMQLTQRQTAILRALRRYWYLRTAQIRDLIVPADSDGSITRNVMRTLLQLGYVRRHEPCLIEPGKFRAPPIYVLTIKGSNALAVATGDCAQILGVEPSFRDWMSLHHYCALSEFHMTLDAAIQAQVHVKMTGLQFEHEIINPRAAGAERFKLHTAVGAGLFCCPDSAFETEVLGWRRAWYVEREMGSDTPGRVAAKKSKGYAAMAVPAQPGPLYHRHFPQAKDFRVLAVCPNPDWRDALRREMTNKPGAALWVFLSITDATPQSILHGQIVYKTDKGPFPMVRSPGAAPPVISGSGPSCGGAAG